MRIINFFWGVIFILLGILFFLTNFNIIAVDWKIIFNLWPFLIILIGVYFLPVKFRVISTLSLTMVIAGIMIYSIQWNQLLSNFELSVDQKAENKRPELNLDFDFEEATSTVGTSLGKTFQFARLKLNAPQGRYQTRVLENQLFNFKTPESTPHLFNLKQSGEGDTGNVALKLVSKTNKALFGLNKRPIWKIDLKLDSSRAALDFTSFRIRKLDLQARQSDLNLKFGKRYSNQQIAIDAEGSQLNIQLPTDAGSEVKLNESLPVDLQLNGLQQQKDKLTYRTNNYPIADKKIHIQLTTEPENLVINRN